MCQYLGGGVTNLTRQKYDGSVNIVTVSTGDKNTIIIPSNKLGESGPI